MLTTIIMSLTAALSPVESISGSDLTAKNNIENIQILDDRRKNQKKLSFDTPIQSLDDRRKNEKKLSHNDVFKTLDDRRKNEKKL